MQTHRFGRAVLVALAVSIFFSAFLLFQVQPIIGKFVLPWFGGSPSVWTTCLLFFQSVLFAGYAYAHCISRWLKMNRQIQFHCLLLLLSLLTLPITPTSQWKPDGHESPTLLILALLLCKVGVPYFLLSATGPLLQSWLGSANLCNQPYRLYSLSNLGSLLALFSFPFLVEPCLASAEQAALWSILFSLFVGLCGACGLGLLKSNPLSHIESIDQMSESDPPSSMEVRLKWFALPALASMMLLATTNQICIDTGVIPFLWIVPLAIYLISFILTFDSSRWYSRRVFIMLTAIAIVLLYSLKILNLNPSLTVALTLYFLILWGGCMVCHGELVALKPATSELTLFYLTLSAGGAFGGLFVGLLAPHLFLGYFEWQLALLGLIMLFLATYLQDSVTWRQVPAVAKHPLACCAMIFTALGLNQWNSISNQQLIVQRNFYGVLSVNRSTDTVTGEPIRKMVHGQIVHGSQYESSEKQLLPTAYYTECSGVGSLLKNYHLNEHRKIGVVGLGAGTLAVYGQSGDKLRFYEINPDVIRLAQQYFTYLSDSLADIELIVGDGRLNLERERSQQFDILVLDAFSGDAIPVHLLTREAMQIYDSHLQRNGVMAVHISNLYLDLRQIVAGLAREFNYQMIVVESQSDDRDSGNLHSTWALLSRGAEELQAVLHRDTIDDSMKPNGIPVLWTDQRSNLLQAIK